MKPFSAESCFPRNLAKNLRRPRRTRINYEIWYLSLYSKDAAKIAHTAKGTTVLGKYPNYLDLAERLRAHRFNIPMDIWNRMSDAERWAANQKFLDRAIRRGDDFILSNPVKNIGEVGGSFRRELDYMIQNGYKLSEDGSRLVTVP